MHDVIVVAGGASRRMGGMDKLVLHDSSGRTLLSVVVEGALDTGAARVVVVGPRRELDVTDERITWTREDPPDGGPLAGVAAGTALATADVVAVVSADAPAAAEAVPDLVSTARPGVTAVLVDDSGRRTLCMAFARPDLQRALQVVGPPQGRSVGSLMNALTVLHVQVLEVVDTWGAAQDVDTREDAARLGWAEVPRPGTGRLG